MAEDGTASHDWDIRQAKQCQRIPIQKQARILRRPLLRLIYLHILLQIGGNLRIAFLRVHLLSLVRQQRLTDQYSFCPEVEERLHAQGHRLHLKRQHQEIVSFAPRRDLHGIGRQRFHKQEKKRRNEWLGHVTVNHLRLNTETKRSVCGK